MGKLYECITPELAAWITEQHMFFVATAPLAERGHVNCSPKGLDALRILGANRVAYLDLTGSGAETMAHLRENGRIVFMFCAFAGPPKIVRLHARGTVVTRRSPGWSALRAQFPDYPAASSNICAHDSRVTESCGYGVPRFDFKEDRDAMLRWAQTKGPTALPNYRRQKNTQSIDGLRALDDADA
jgi:hypothetical protein